jgi:hypothetical protein
MGRGSHSHRYSRTARKWSHAKVGDIFERVVEAVGEVRHADRKRQLDDLSFILELVQFLELGGPNGGRGARHAIGIFVRERLNPVRVRVSLREVQPSEPFMRSVLGSP